MNRSSKKYIASSLHCSILILIMWMLSSSDLCRDAWSVFGVVTMVTFFYNGFLGFFRCCASGLGWSKSFSSSLSRSMMSSIWLLVILLALYWFSSYSKAPFVGGILIFTSISSISWEGSRSVSCSSERTWVWGSMGRAKSTLNRGFCSN